MGAFRVERLHFFILWGAVWSYALRWLMLPAPIGWGGAFVLCCMCLFLLTFYVVVLLFVALLAFYHAEPTLALCALTALQEVGTKKLLKICALIVETRIFNG